MKKNALLYLLCCTLGISLTTDYTEAKGGRTNNNSRQQKNTKGKKNLDNSAFSLATPWHEANMAADAIMSKGRNINQLLSSRDAFLKKGQFTSLGYHVMWYAVLKKDVQTLKTLMKFLEDKFNFNAETPIDKYGNSMLHTITGIGWSEGLKSVISKDSHAVNIQNNVGRTPIHIAVEMGDYDSLKEMLKSKDADLSIKNKQGYTPLHLAIRNYKAVINKVKTDNVTKGILQIKNNTIAMGQLHQNSRISNSLRIIYELIKFEDKSNSYHSSLDTQDSKGNTPLHLASIIGNKKIILWLLASGADPRIINNNRKIPAEVFGGYSHASDVPLHTDSDIDDSLEELLNIEAKHQGRNYKFELDKNNKTLLKTLGVL